MTGALAYLRFDTRDLDAWADLAAHVIGMHVERAGDDVVRLRLDERAQRVTLQRADAARLAAIGIEVDGAALEPLLQRLTAAGVAVHDGTAAECVDRAVATMRWFADPDGNRVEIVTQPADASTPFAPGRALGAFRTDDLGLGHIALAAERFDAMRAFYHEVVGLGFTDEMGAPFRAAFFHLNRRHHSLAVIGAETAGVYHVMVEYADLDDLGRAYDLALTRADAIVTTLGRHTNDHVLSFYLRTPDAFTIEVAWAGRSIDPATWVPEPVHGPSLWGHERSWLPPEKREEARAMQREIAHVRAPNP